MFELPNRPKRVAMGAAIIIAVGVSCLGIVRVQRFIEPAGGVSYACSTGKACVEGSSTGSPYGVYGLSTGGNGVEGRSSAAERSGVSGVQLGASGIGVYGESHDTSKKYAAVFARGDESTTNIFYGENAATHTSCLIDPHSNLICTGSIEGTPSEKLVGVMGKSNEEYGVEGVSYLTDGVYGVTSSTTGSSGVSGIAMGGSGVAYGVFGSSSTGAGVYGQGSSPNTVGVYGQSSNAYGVQGISTSGPGVSGGSTKGYGVQGGSTDNFGVYGGSSNAPGVFGTSSNTYGVEGDSTKAAGVYGTASSGYGVEGTSASSSGLYGITSSATAGGVYGTVSKGGYGVVGVDTNDGLVSEAGVYGIDVSSGTGVWGQSPAGIAIAANVSSSAGELFYGQGVSGASCLMDGLANLTCTGTIMGGTSLETRHRTGTGRHVLAFASESTSATIEDFGTARMIRGIANVPIESTFASTIDPSGSYYVFLTPLGDTRGLYVSMKTPTEFKVRETEGGHSSLAFDYRIVAHPADASNGRLPDAPAVKRHHIPRISRAGQVSHPR